MLIPGISNLLRITAASAEASPRSSAIKFTFVSFSKMYSRSSLPLASTHLPIQGRIDDLNIPAKRADIIPAALITIATFMNHFDIDQIEYSKCSLKMGILKEMLGL